jgi:hypothetical protein
MADGTWPVDEYIPSMTAQFPCRSRAKDKFNFFPGSFSGSNYRGVSTSDLRPGRFLISMRDILAFAQAAPRLVGFPQLA